MYFALTLVLLNIDLFFFQAEDGIRDLTVTGVQTCALPILDVYALPLARVMEVLHAPRTSLGWFDGRAVLDRRSHTLPLVDLRQWLDVTPAASTLLTIVVLQAGEARFGLVVDQVRGREEVVIKPLPKALRGLRGYAGATRSEEHTSELQSQSNLVCRLLLEKKKK